MDAIGYPPLPNFVPPEVTRAIDDLVYEFNRRIESLENDIEDLRSEVRLLEGKVSAATGYNDVDESFGWKRKSKSKKFFRCPNCCEYRTEKIYNLRRHIGSCLKKTPPLWYYFPTSPSGPDETGNNRAKSDVTLAVREINQNEVNPTVNNR